MAKGISNKKNWTKHKGLGVSAGLAGTPASRCGCSHEHAALLVINVCTPSAPRRPVSGTHDMHTTHVRLIMCYAIGWGRVFSQGIEDGERTKKRWEVEVGTLQYSNSTAES